MVMGGRAGVDMTHDVAPRGFLSDLATMMSPTRA